MAYSLTFFKNTAVIASLSLLILVGLLALPRQAQHAEAATDSWGWTIDNRLDEVGTGGSWQNWIDSRPLLINSSNSGSNNSWQTWINERPLLIPTTTTSNPSGPQTAGWQDWIDSRPLLIDGPQTVQKRDNYGWTWN